MTTGTNSGGSTWLIVLVLVTILLVALLEVKFNFILEGGYKDGAGSSTQSVYEHKLGKLTRKVKVQSSNIQTIYNTVQDTRDVSQENREDILKVQRLTCITRSRC